MEQLEEGTESRPVTVFSGATSFNGLLKFKNALRIEGKFQGTIDAPTGALIVDRDATVEADRIRVVSLTVYGKVTGQVQAVDKIDMHTGSVVKGNVSGARIRIADGVDFEGQCSMTEIDRDLDIFSKTAEEIKAELLNMTSGRSHWGDDD
jgi:cytoskeletal protein CcmA (bactofilin family)